MSEESKNLLNLCQLCQQFMDDHPFKQEGHQGYDFEDEEFIEKAGGEDITQFFEEMYNILLLNKPK
jgi:hypothetical protein